MRVKISSIRHYLIYIKLCNKIFDKFGNQNNPAQKKWLFPGKTLIEANDNMVDWIIEKLNIDHKSIVLDIGCGRGKYTVEIAKKTGQ